MKKPANVVSPIPTHEQIAERAQEIYVERGAKPGRELDDWLQAEYELMRLPVQKLAKMDAPKVTKKLGRKLAVVSLVQAAMLLGTIGRSALDG